MPTLELFLLGFVIVTFPTQMQSQDAKQVGDFRFVYYSRKKTYEQADTFCKCRDGWLAEPRYQTIDTVVTGFTGFPVWIGLTHDGASWKWGDGNPIRYSNWNVNTSNSLQHTCTQASTGNGWLPVSCHTELRFACQFDTKFEGNYELTFVTDSLKNFNDATAACKANGSRLVDVKNSKLNDLIKAKLIRNERTFFTSGNDIVTDGRWKWGDGCDLDEKVFSDWLKKPKSNWVEPNGGTRENCLVMIDFGQPNFWYDVECSNERNYVCQKDIQNGRCSSQLCLNHGKCTRRGRRYSCNCNIGYYGSKCEKDYCDPSPCKNSGTCQHSAISPYYNCTCPVEYTGSDCSELVYTEKDGCSYHVHDTQPKTTSYLNAQKFCKDIAGTLAMLKTSEIQNVIQKQMIKQYGVDGSRQFWFGGSKSNGVWLWADGSRMPMTGPNQKWSSKTGVTVVMSSWRSKKLNGMLWYGKSRTDSAFGFVCEKPDVNPCDNYCLNNGACTSVGCQAKCTCSNMHSGDKCQRNKIQFEKISTAGSDSVGDRVNVTCHFNGIPVPNVTWVSMFKQTTQNLSTAVERKNKNFVIYEHRKSDSVISTLVIRQREFLNKAKIGCYAENQFESSKTEYIIPNSDMHFERNITYRLVNHSQDHASSLNECVLRNRKLLQIPNKLTQASITQLLKNWNIQDDVFLDLKKHIVGNSIIWMQEDGSPVYNETAHGNSGVQKIVDGKYVAWDQSQPASSSGECVVLRKSSNWLWSVVDCSHSAVALCQRPVLGKMKEFQVSIGKCKTEIAVKFTSGDLVKDFFHLLEITNNGTGEIVQTKYYLPRSRKDHAVVKSFQVQNGTTYNVKVAVCPNCPAPFYTSVLGTTDAIVPAAEREVLEFRVTLNGSRCVLNWDVNKIGVIGFQVNVSKNPKVLYGDVMLPMNETFSISRYDRDYIVATRPNSKYAFTAQTKTCGGIGPSNSPSGQCITDTAAPATITTPLLMPRTNKNSDVVPIRIPVPDQRNGPVSCILIIVSINATKFNATRTVTMESIKTAVAKSSSPGTFSPGDEYLALAIPRSSILSEMDASGSLQQQLGDGNTTQCDASIVNALSNSTRRRRSLSKEVLLAKNRALDQWTNYSFIVATTTPGDTTIYVKSSEPVRFTKYPTQLSPGGLAIGAIAGIALGILAILMLSIIIFIVISKRNKAQSRKNNRTEPGGVTMDAVREGNDFVYANLALDVVSHGSKTAIPLDNLLSVYNDMSADDKRKFREQYSNLKAEAKELPYPTNIASSEAVRKMNRYKNVIPADHSRVILKAINSEYINASFIHGFDKAKKYIATQGPIPSTVEHFWWMVLEQKSTVIVMLTRCMEGRKNKCAQYWPTQGNVSSHGEIKVRNMSEENFGSFVIRTLTVDTTDQSHTVKQVHFLTWPDHGVPATTTNLLACHKEVSKLTSDAPIIVHCSAGAGRSGAFIAYDILKSEGKSTGSVDVYTCILKMRENRVDMVQTADQFVLVHKLLAENHAFGDTSLLPDQLLEGYDWKSKSKKEFRNLSLIGPLNEELVIANNPAFNRDPEVIPYRRNRVSVVMKIDETAVPYINASFIESFDSGIRMIASQGPLESTQDMFWRCVLDHKATTIVSLTTCYENEQEQSVMYWPEKNNDSLSFGDITVQLTSVNTKGKTVTRILNVCRNNEVLTLQHFQYLGWSTQKCPKDSAEVLDLVQKVSARSYSEKDASVLVHCSDGAGRTGAFCTIFNLVMQSKSGQAIDVFRAAKDVRDCRPKMIQTVDQYRFCYQTMLMYLNLNPVYSSVGENVQQHEETIYENLK